MPLEELRALLSVLRARGLTRQRIRRIAIDAMRAGGSVRAAAAALEPHLDRSAAGAAQVEADLLSTAHLALTVIRIDDPRYPAALAAIPDPPIALFVSGSVTALATPLAVAVVGSRRCSPPGRGFARSIAADLGRAGVSIVSGLAVGIDGSAHRGALDVGAPTVAIIGAGHCNLYPTSHRGLAREIVAAGGIVVSEYPPTTRPWRANFPERNRIVSGIAAGVLVVEATARSGSLITARMALEQGREVMAVPGSVSTGQHEGCHRLIKQGAALVEDAADVLHAFGLEPISASSAVAPLDPILRRVLETLAATPIALHQIVESVEMSTEEVLPVLVELELQGFVEVVHGGYIRRPR